MAILRTTKTHSIIERAGAELGDTFTSLFSGDLTTRGESTDDLGNWYSAANSERTLDIDESGEIIREGVSRPGSPLFDGIRGIRRELTSKKSIQTVTVCSARPGEGKSLIATLLAASFAVDLGRPTLLVDCNIGRPSILGAVINAKFGGDIGVLGLVNMLHADVPLELSDIVWSTSIENLKFLPQGALASEKPPDRTLRKLEPVLKTIIGQSGDLTIILDAGSTRGNRGIVGIDISDSVLIVVRAEETLLEEVEETRHLAKSRDVGVVLNAFRGPWAGQDFFND